MQIETVMSLKLNLIDLNKSPYYLINIFFYLCALFF
jgi:hypothetical protein